VNCPHCGKILGDAARCACGYDREAASYGRPSLEAITALPRSPRTNGGIAMLVGGAMVAGGVYLIYLAQEAGAARTDPKYLIAWCTTVAGLLCFRRGYDRSTD
jgi:hypothetical protein